MTKLHRLVLKSVPPAARPLPYRRSTDSQFNVPIKVAVPAASCLPLIQNVKTIPSRRTVFSDAKTFGR
jgi:hypothetical protein